MALTNERTKLESSSISKSIKAAYPDDSFFKMRILFFFDIYSQDLVQKIKDKKKTNM